MVKKFSDLGDSANDLRAKRYRKKQFRDQLVTSSGTTDPTEQWQFIHCAMAGCGSLHEKVLARQAEFCEVLRLHNPYPHPLLQLGLEEGMSNRERKIATRKTMKALPEDQKSAIRRYNLERTEAHKIRRALLIPYVQTLKGKRKAARDQIANGGCGINVVNNIWGAIERELSENDALSVALGKAACQRGPPTLEEAEPGLESKIRRVWMLKCRSAAGKKGKKGALVIQGLVGDVVQEIKDRINKDSTRPPGSKKVTRYLVQKCRPPKARLASARTDLCPLCVGGAHLRRRADKMVAGIEKDNGNPGWTMEEWAETDIDELKGTVLKKCLRALEEVDFHKEDVERSKECVDERIKKACATDSKVVFIQEDFGTDIELGKEEEGLNSSPAAGWATCVGFRAWHRGRTKDTPMRIHVVSDDPGADHSAFSGHHALERVVLAVPIRIRLLADEISIFTDNGGHFQAHNFTGAVLEIIPAFHHFTKAELGHCPCYHGKNGVDGDFRHGDTLLNSYIKNNPKKLVHDAKGCVAALNEEWAKSQTRQELFGKRAKKRDYLAIYCDLGALPPTGKRYAEIVVPNLRSTYCLRSEFDEQKKERFFYNMGTPFATGNGKLLGGSEMVVTVDRPEPQEKKKKKPPYKRMLSTKDHELKRRRRDNWAGLPQRGKWGDVDAEMRALARTPTEEEDGDEWCVAQIEQGISNPGKFGRVIIEDGRELQHGQVVGEGSFPRCEVGPSVEIRISTVSDTFSREFSTPRLLELFNAEKFSFLPQRMPSAKAGEQPVRLVPWGEDDDRVEKVDEGSGFEKIWMALCVGCGHWRTVPFQTRRKFQGKKAQFYCRHSPWIDDCKSPLNECEAKYKRVGHRQADRRGGE